MRSERGSVVDLVERQDVAQPRQLRLGVLIEELASGIVDLEEPGQLGGDPLVRRWPHGGVVMDSERTQPRHRSRGNTSNQ